MWLDPQSELAKRCPARPAMPRKIYQRACWILLHQHMPSAPAPVSAIVAAHRADLVEMTVADPDAHDSHEHGSHDMRCYMRCYMR